MTPFGVVISTDSQDATLIEGDYCLPDRPNNGKHKIMPIRSLEFRAVIGYVGAESIDGKQSRDWLLGFGQRHYEDDLATFCGSLASELTEAWNRTGSEACLWVFVGGYDDEARFWYVVNGTFDQHSGTYVNVGPTFRAVNDLDQNYIPHYVRAGHGKDAVLAERIFYFRNGAAMFPSARVFDAFTGILEVLVAHPVAGFPRVRTLDHYGFAARQRMEFIKRLYSEDHGLYDAKVPPVGGDVHVLAVTPDHEFAEYYKIRSQTNRYR